MLLDKKVFLNKSVQKRVIPPSSWSISVPYAHVNQWNGKEIEIRGAEESIVQSIVY